MGTVTKLKDDIPDWDNDDVTFSYTEDAVDELKLLCERLLSTASKNHSELVKNYGDEYVDASPIVLSNAYYFINLFNSEITIPDISITKDGRVYFEWYKAKNNMVGVIIGDKIADNDYVLHYSAIFGSNNQEMGMKPINNTGYVDIVSLLNKLNAKVLGSWPIS